MADREIEHLTSRPRTGRDVNAVAITKFGIGLTLIVLVTLFGCGAFFITSRGVTKHRPGSLPIWRSNR